MSFPSRRLKRLNPLQSAHPSRNIWVHQTYGTQLTLRKYKQTCDNSKAWFNFQTAKKTSHNAFFRFLMPTKMRQIFWTGRISSKISISVLRQTMTLQRSNSDQAEYPTQARKKATAHSFPAHAVPPPPTTHKARAREVRLRMGPEKKMIKKKSARPRARAPQASPRRLRTAPPAARAVSSAPPHPAL